MHMFGADKGFMGGHGIVGAQTALALGLAWAIKYRGQDRVCVCFMGDAAVNQHALDYINRLSDHLFVLARQVNDAEGSDILWRPGANR